MIITNDLDFAYARFDNLDYGEVFIIDNDTTTPYMKIRDYMDDNAVCLENGATIHLNDNDIVCRIQAELIMRG